MKLTGPITHQWIELITETETVLSRISPTREETSSESYMTPSGETLPGTRRPIPLLSMKAARRIGTWNVRTMYETSKAAQVANEMGRYNIAVLGICESRWDGAGRITLATGEQLVYSGHDNEQQAHTEGVAFMMSKLAAKALIKWVPVSSRIITARFNSKGRKVTLINCYAPTNNTTDELQKEFYDSLQGVLDRTPRRDIRILMGDLNAKLGSDNTGRERIMGRHGLGWLNENGERFAYLCAFNDLAIGDCIFPHKTIHKATWISPDGRSSNQIDHIAIGRKWRRSLIDVRVKRGADVASDHHLLLEVIKVKLRANQDRTCTPHYKYNTQNLKSKEIADTFSCSVKNRYSALEFVEEDVDSHWTALAKVL